MSAELRAAAERLVKHETADGEYKADEGDLYEVVVDGASLARAWLAENPAEPVTPDDGLPTLTELRGLFKGP